MQIASAFPGMPLLILFLSLQPFTAQNLYDIYFIERTGSNPQKFTAEVA